MPLSEPERLRSLPPYLFVDIDRKRRAAIAAGKDIINFGVGDPDQPTPDFIIEAAAAAIRRPANHRYPSDTGAPQFRHAAATFMQARYGVDLDPDREILGLIGTKEGIGHLPLAVVNPGQTVLIPDPGYPVYRAATLFAGGVPRTMRLREQNGWQPELEGISAEVARSAALMFVNYPNNPTGATVSLDFYRRVVDFARRYDVVLASDAAYNEVYLGGERPASVLQVRGAGDVAVEFHSLSKTFNMTGWRLGFAAGNAGVLAALARLKSNLDSGQFTALQESGAAALAGFERPEVARVRAMYRERAEVLCAGLREVGFRVQVPAATFYVWAGVPRGVDSWAVVNRLLEEACVVCMPGQGFGAGGEGYVRFALTVDVERIREAVERMRRVEW